MDPRIAQCWVCSCSPAGSAADGSSRLALEECSCRRGGSKALRRAGHRWDRWASTMNGIPPESCPVSSSAAPSSRCVSGCSSRDRRTRMRGRSRPVRDSSLGCGWGGSALERLHGQRYLVDSVNFLPNQPALTNKLDDIVHHNITNEV